MKKSLTVHRRYGKRAKAEAVSQNLQGPGARRVIFIHPPKTENPPQTLAGQSTPGMRSGENR
jgi:hypothetical protein